MPEDGPDKARLFAEKIRKLVEEKAFNFENKEIPVTISMGVAEMDARHDRAHPVHQGGGRQPVQGQEAGRNRVVWLAPRAPPLRGG